MKQCMHKIETVKVPKGNAFGLLLPFKTARWEDAELVPDNIDIRYLEDVVIMIDDQPWAYRPPGCRTGTLPTRSRRC